MIEEATETQSSEGFPGEISTEEVVSALLARASATVDATAATAKLATVEARLAMSSAALFIAFIVLLAVMVLVTWALMLATAFASLVALGMSAVASLATLLLLQMIICGLLVYTLSSLSKNMSFPRTRQALRRSITN